MWYVTTSVNEHSHQRVRKPFPVHPGVPLLHVQTAFSYGDVLGCLSRFIFLFILSKNVGERSERGARERKIKNTYFIFPHHHPLALAVNKSPPVHILSPALNGLLRENRGSVNRLRMSKKTLPLLYFKSSITHLRERASLFLATFKIN